MIKYYNNLQIYKSYVKLNLPFYLNISYNSIIPLNLYTCWHTKELPPLMKINYNKLIQGNPRIQFHLFDETDCRDFIQKNFDNNVLESYNSLIPCSYKSDLWRYCVLYTYGGIYMDIKYTCVNGFKFIALTEKEHFPTDLIISEYPNEKNKAVFNGLMCSLPKNEKLLKTIDQIVINVKNNFYGNSPLDITGPILFGKFFTYDEKEKSVTKRYVGKQGNGVSIKGIIILNEYPEYRIEQKNISTHYSEYWKNNNVYN